MTTYKRGDVVLVDFGFSDSTGSKKRPAYVLSGRAFQRHRRQAILGVITSRLDARFPGDWVIKDWESAGLHHPSRATAVLRTVSISLIEKLIGRLSDADLDGLLGELKPVLGFQHG